MIVRVLIRLLITSTSRIQILGCTLHQICTDYHTLRTEKGLSLTALEKCWWKVKIRGRKWITIYNEQGAISRSDEQTCKVYCTFEEDYLKQINMKETKEKRLKEMYNWKKRSVMLSSDSEISRVCNLTNQFQNREAWNLAAASAATFSVTGASK